MRAPVAMAVPAPEEPEADAPAPEFEAEDEIDLAALTDVPPESVKGPYDQLAEAFPGRIEDDFDRSGRLEKALREVLFPAVEPARNVSSEIGKVFGKLRTPLGGPGIDAIDVRISGRVGE